MAIPGLTDFVLWSKSGWPHVEVVGETYYQEGIRSLLRDSPAGDGREYEFTAHLVPEPSNKHDRNAIRVDVQGHPIGYLPKEIAPDYGPVLSTLIAQGLAPSTACRIWAYDREEWTGLDRRGNDVYRQTVSAHASVVLDAPHRIVPMNLAPTRSHAVLPHGSALQVRGEEKHLDVLTPWVSRHGEGWVFGELRAIEIAGKSPKTVVELTVDDALIGELTPAMSAHFIPVINHCDRLGATTVAKVLLKGNAMKVEAVLHAAKSHELGSDWLESIEGNQKPAQASEKAPAVGADHPVTAGVVGRDFSLPPRPDRIVFNPPPGWPPAPPDWSPPPGWRPDPDWPAPPANWSFWVLG